MKKNQKIVFVEITFFFCYRYNFFEKRAGGTVRAIGYRQAGLSENFMRLSESDALWRRVSRDCFYFFPAFVVVFSKFSFLVVLNAYVLRIAIAVYCRRTILKKSIFFFKIPTKKNAQRIVNRFSRQKLPPRYCFIRAERTTPPADLPL